MNKERPSALLAIAVLGIVLGSLGSCTGCFGVVGQLASSQMNAMSEQMLANQPGMTPQMLEAQQRYLGEVEALSARFRPVMVVGGLANLVTSIALVAAGILLVRWHARGPSVFVGAAAASAVSDLFAGVVGALFQRASGELMKDYMGSLMGGAGAPGGDHFAGAIATASTSAAMCFAGVWVLLKLAYYVTGVVYLRKPQVRAMFPAA